MQVNLRVPKRKWQKQALIEESKGGEKERERDLICNRRAFLSLSLSFGAPLAQIGNFFSVQKL